MQAVLHDTDVLQFTGGGTEVYGGDVARVIGHLLTNPAVRPLPGVDIVHLSDLYVTQRDIVQLVRKISGHAGEMPTEPTSQPANPLVCRRLNELGIVLGGRSMLEKAVTDLVDAAASHVD